MLLGAGIATIFFNSIRDGAAIYYFKYYLRTQDAFSLPSLKLTIGYYIDGLTVLIGAKINIRAMMSASEIFTIVVASLSFVVAFGPLVFFDAAQR